MDRRIAGAGVALMIFGCVWMAGCGKREAAPAVLAERTEAEAGTAESSAGSLGSGVDSAESMPGNSGNGGSFGTGNSGNGSSSETGNSGNGGSFGTGNSGSGSSSEMGRASGIGEKDSLRVKTEAPERYQAEVRTDSLKISADAPVEVPEKDEIPVMVIEKRPYSEEEYQLIKVIFSQLWGIEWGTEEVKNQYDYPVEDEGMGIRDKSGEYYLSFWSGEKPKTSSIIWMKKNRSFADWSFSFSETDEKKAKVMQELKEKSEEFLKLLGADEMELTETRWGGISENDKAVPGVCFWYRHTCEGIPILGSGYSALGETSKSGTQYFRFLYTMDGEPVEIMGISRETYRRKGTEEEFLLPFEAIAQIFEQHCRVYDGQSEAPAYNAEAEYGNLALIPGENPVSEFAIPVTRVALEYRYFGAGYGEGTLIPVWNFYGMVPAGLTLGDSAFLGDLSGNREVLLVSIGAGDGVIY